MVDGGGVTFLIINLFFNHQNLIDVLFHNKIARLVFVLIIIFFIHDIYLKKENVNRQKKKKKIDTPLSLSFASCLLTSI